MYFISLNSAIIYLISKNALKIQRYPTFLYTILQNQILLYNELERNKLFNENYTNFQNNCPQLKRHKSFKINIFSYIIFFEFFFSSSFLFALYTSHSNFPTLCFFFFLFFLLIHPYQGRTCTCSNAESVSELSKLLSRSLEKEKRLFYPVLSFSLSIFFLTLYLYLAVTMRTVSNSGSRVLETHFYTNNVKV